VRSHRTYDLPKKQNGAVLFVALIMLLVITLLAVSSMREVALESQITGNLMEQKRLSSTAESALREAEWRLENNGVPPDVCTGSNPTTLCITEIANTYDTDFSVSTAYKGADGATTLERSARWYVRDATNVGSVQANCTQTEDILSGKNCTNYYEVNGQAFNDNNTAGKECGPDALCIRSVIAAIFN